VDSHLRAPPPFLPLSHGYLSPAPAAAWKARLNCSNAVAPTAVAATGAGGTPAPFPAVAGGFRVAGGGVAGPHSVSAAPTGAAALRSAALVALAGAARETGLAAGAAAGVMAAAPRAAFAAPVTPHTDATAGLEAADAAIGPPAPAARARMRACSR